MLLRKSGATRIATLKRVPTSQELSNFDISKYPKSLEELYSDKWNKSLSKLEAPTKNRYNYLLSEAGELTSTTIEDLNQVILFFFVIYRFDSLLIIRRISHRTADPRLRPFQRNSFDRKR